MDQGGGGESRARCFSDQRQRGESLPSVLVIGNRRESCQERIVSTRIMLRAVLRSASKSSQSPMQAIVVAALGDSSCLQLRTDVPIPTAGPGHVLVKLEYSGVNYIDVYFRSGLYPTQLPFTPGALPH